MDKQIALVCSSGGHLFELWRLKDCFERLPHFWVTFPTEDARVLLKDEPVYWAFSPTNRNIKNFVKNLFLAARILKRRKPTHVITTGAGVAVPFIYVAKLLGVKTIYLESLARIENLSLSGKLVYFLADHFLVQWEQLARRYRKAVYGGRVV